MISKRNTDSKKIECDDSRDKKTKTAVITVRRGKTKYEVEHLFTKNKTEMAIKHISVTKVDLTLI